LLAAALLDGLFAHPAWLFSVAPNLDICDGYSGHDEFFRSLLEVASGPVRFDALSVERYSTIPTSAFIGCRILRQ
jgi:hypothetical protein